MKLGLKYSESDKEYSFEARYTSKTAYVDMQDIVKSTGYNALKWLHEQDKRSAFEYLVKFFQQCAYVDDLLEATATAPNVEFYYNPMLEDDEE